MRKLTILFLIICFFASQAPQACLAGVMPEFICELGMKFYQQGRFDEAMHEFRKALIVQPGYEPALRYIQMIEQVKGKAMGQADIIPINFQPTSTTSSGAIKELMDLIEIQREMVSTRRLTQPQLPQAEGIAGLSLTRLEKKAAPVIVLTLDDSFNNIAQPIDIEEGSSVILVGKNIQRFLATEPDILTIVKKSADELLITGNSIGYTYLHVWDDFGRWTSEWLGVFPKPVAAPYAERMRRDEESARNFKLRYYMDWSSFEYGRRINSWRRSSYAWSHGLTLNGGTPYGDLDSAINVRSLATSTDLTYVTIGLSNGQLGPFKGFSLRGADFSPAISNLAFPGASLRGGMFSSPAFHNKLSYTAFWGRDGGGRYGNLSPSLSKTQNSFLEGVNLSLSPTGKQNYQFTLAHAWGRDRQATLKSYGYDLYSNWNLDKWGLSYEVANDTQSFSHLLRSRFRKDKLSFGAEIRNVDKKFLSISGNGWRQGEVGGLFNFNYQATEKLQTGATLDIYRDRLFPAEERPHRLNEDFNWNANYQIDKDTGLNLYYTINNDLGKVSQSRYQGPGVTLSRNFQFITDMSAYTTYSHQESIAYSSHDSDYINDRIYTGLRFSLIGDLYYYLNREHNFVRERFFGTRSHPSATETGVDWSGLVSDKYPLYGTFRFSYRNEEDTVSNLRFLSGQDYIEGYTELSYRPSDSAEIYGSTRVRNVWAEAPDIAKHIEGSFNAGMRYTWDTGVRWESRGNIEGYVFKDFNADGLRQRDEPPIEGVRVWLGKDKSALTDIFGYYQFTGIRARKAYVTIDTSTLPEGYVLTGPVTQEVAIAEGRALRVDFGMSSRTEIRGLVFEDVNLNGEYDLGDKGVTGALLILEDGKRSLSDASGSYAFTGSSPGEHTITLDLNSLPVYYLPQVPISKEVTLFEGVTYMYNIPLKRVKK